MEKIIYLVATLFFLTIGILFVRKAQWARKTGRTFIKANFDPLSKLIAPTITLSKNEVGRKFFAFTVLFYFVLGVVFILMAIWTLALLFSFFSP